MVELGLNLSEQPVKGFATEPELLSHAAGTERGPQVDVEEQRGILLGLPAQRVIPIHNHQLLAQFPDSWGAKQEVERLQIRVQLTSSPQPGLEATKQLLTLYHLDGV